MKDFWEQRYAEDGYSYGEAPNSFLKSVIDTVTPGTILLPAEGEGRNAVYCASIGWEVDCFDYSENGKKKALELAEKRGVHINYAIDNLMSFRPTKSYNAIALTYIHQPPDIRKKIHGFFTAYLKPGGIIVLEAFAKEQLGNSSGGPADISMLYSMEELSDDFSNLSIEALERVTCVLTEGKYHQGKAEIVRMIGRKK